MEVTHDNYFSKEANEQYFGFTQVKNFLSCQARAKAIIDGELVQAQTDQLLVGQYLHACSAGTLCSFVEGHPEMFKKDGTLKATFVKAEEAKETLSADECCQYYLSGCGKEVIFTAYAFGAQWKIMIDVYNPDNDFFSDLKFVKSIKQKEYDERTGRYENFIVRGMYHYQVALYAYIEKKVTGRKRMLKPYIVAVSKEDPPDKGVFYFDEEDINGIISEIEEIMPEIIKVKSGEREAKRCEKCDYCRKTKVLKQVDHYLSV